MVETRTIGNFELLERIGQGGMGAVFKARQISMERIVAVKVLPPRLAQQPMFIERFIREAHASAQLSHPNIVRGIDVGEAGGIYFFAMEFVEGASAKTLIRPGGLPEAQVVGIGVAVAEALAHAHQRGILHRDVKPDNILIDKSGTPKLCDLGLARLESQSEEEKSLTQDGTAMGTPHYISPEQARGQADLDATTDLYSLGATLYHLLTGATMFSGATAAVIMAQHLTSACPSPAERGVVASRGLVSVLAKLLVKDRSGRYESARQAADDLSRVAKLDAPLHAQVAQGQWPFHTGQAGFPSRKLSIPGAAMPSDGGQAAHHAPRRATLPRSSRRLAMIAVVVVVALAAWSLSGSGDRTKASADTPLPPPVAGRADAGTPAQQSGTQAAERQRQFDAAEELMRQNPLRYAEAIAAFDAVRTAAAGTELATRSAQAIAEITKRRDEAVELSAKPSADAAAALAHAGRFDSAIAVWEKAARGEGGQLAGRAGQSIAALRVQAETAMQGALDQAAVALKDKRWPAAATALDAAQAIEYRAGHARVETLRETLAQEQKAEAEAVQNAILAKADTAFSKHAEMAVDAAVRMDLAALDKVVSDTRADPAVQVVPAKVQGLSETSSALEKAAAAARSALEALKDGKEHSFVKGKETVTGTVTQVTADEISVQIALPGGGSAGMKVRIADLPSAERLRLAGAAIPGSASEYVAHAILALAAGDARVAKADLAHAAEHPLAPACQARVDEKLLGAVEAAAKTAWEAIQRAAGAGKVPEQRAKELLERIRAFTAEHGKTAFAAAVADKLAALTERLSGQAAPLGLDLGGGMKLEVILVNAGKFVMGSPVTEDNRTVSEIQHAVTITQPFYLGRFPVTQEQFESVMGKNPSMVKGPRQPVTMVSWLDAEEFCRRVGAKIDKLVRLPSEAEWEYACRAGTTTAYFFGDSDMLLGDYAWFKDNSEDLPIKNFASKVPHPVGTKKPNAWGLYDMHGNVSEWCQDWLDKLPDQAQVDPLGPAAGKARVLRGGSCNLSPGDCRSAFRLGYPPERVSSHVGGFGFRIAVGKN